MSAALVKGQLARLAALGGHDVNIEIAVVLAGEGEPLAVGRELGEKLTSGMSGDAASYASGSRGEPDIPCVDEGDLVAAHVREPHQTAFLRLLREGECGEEQNDGDTVMASVWHD